MRADDLKIKNIKVCSTSLEKMWNQCNQVCVQLFNTPIRSIARKFCNIGQAICVSDIIDPNTLNHF